MDILKIYTGASRTAKVWKLRELSWSELVERLRSPIRTPESFAEYKAAGKARQGQIKDVGGFVGGVLQGGLRRAGSVVERSLITLDADSPSAGFVDLCFKSLACDFCLYSTHSHSPEAPRFRLIIPVDRPLAPDEYQAAARRVAGDLGIDYFDDSTFEPSRLMYWPSCSQDAEYVFEEQSFMGPLAVGPVLDKYADWRDCSQWPASSRVVSIHTNAGKQADPLAKSGVIGAFCNAYSVPEAISQFLGDIYAPCGIKDRYTYTKGSTTAGLVVYDDKFAYSNHGTDPAGGRLCNAFDLVRIHLFGGLDSEAKPETPTNRLPSFLAMSDMALELPPVKSLLVARNLAEASEAFAGVDASTPLGDWTGELAVDKAGHIRQTAANIRLILDNDPNLAGVVYKDAFAEKLKLAKRPPWRPDFVAGAVWQDADDAGLRVYFENTYGITQARKIEDVFAVWVEGKTRHPVREYLDALVWDGVPRLDRLLIDYLGAADSPYIRAVTRKTLTAAVTRIYKPGAKFDSMLVLVGPQGIGKSTLIQKLGSPWHTDSLVSVQGKEGPEQIRGFWLVEMGELTAMKRAEETAVKQFLSKREDSFRPAYARHTRVFPRQCVFFGTTNVEQFLKDTTGNRRFWVVPCYQEPPAASVFDDLDSVRDQIWAEALDFYRKKEPLFLPPEIEAEASEIQRAHLEESPFAGAVRKYLNMKVPPNWEAMDTADKVLYFAKYSEEEDHPDCEPVRRVCALMLWVEALGGAPANLDRVRAKEINEVVRQAPGWFPGRIYSLGPYGYQKGFINRNI